MNSITKWLLVSGGIFTLLSIGLDLSLMFGPWTPSTEGDRVMFTGLKSIGYALGLLLVAMALAVGGPIGSLNFELSKDGAKASIKDDDNDTTP